MERLIPIFIHTSCHSQSLTLVLGGYFFEERSISYIFRSCLRLPSSGLLLRQPIFAYPWLANEFTLYSILAIVQAALSTELGLSFGIPRAHRHDRACLLFLFLTFTVPHSTNTILSFPFSHSFHPLSYFPLKNYCMVTSFALLRKDGGLHCTHYFSPSSW